MMRMKNPSLLEVSSMNSLDDSDNENAAQGIEMREAHFPGRAPIDTYGNGGFRFSSMSHRGSILCLPSGIYGWDVSTPDQLNTRNFRKALEEACEHRDSTHRQRC